MLFSHHSHSLLHEYVSDQNLQLKQETRWSWKKNPGDCSDRLMGLLLPLFCSSSRALIHLAEQSELLLSPMGSAADSTCSAGPEKPTNKGQQGSTGANGAGVTTKENDLEYKMVTDYLYYIYQNQYTH